MKKFSQTHSLLSIIDSEFPQPAKTSNGSDNPTLQPSLIRLAEKNGLLFALIDRIESSNSNFRLPVELDRRREQEYLAFSAFKRTVETLQETCRNRGIDYVLIKACTTVPHAPRDVDIYVRPEDLIRLVGSLQEKGFSCAHSDDVDTTLTHGELLSIDIYTGLCYFTFEFIDGGFLWNSCSTSELFGVQYQGLTDEANFLVTMIHSVFGHRSITLLDFLHMRRLMGQIQDMGVCREYARSKGWGGAYDCILEDLMQLSESMYVHNDPVEFPYLFKRRFIRMCASQINGLNMSLTNRIFFEISLLEDVVTFMFKDTKIYDLCRSCAATRSAINGLGYFIRNMRGDKRSN